MAPARGGRPGSSSNNVTRITHAAHHGDTFFDECYAESTLCEDVKLRARNLWDASGDSLVVRNVIKTSYFTMFYGGRVLGVAGRGVRTGPLEKKHDVSARVRTSEDKVRTCLFFVKLKNTA